jgi:hypothetical protein
MSEASSAQSHSKLVKTAATARLTGGTRRPHRSTRSGISPAGPSTQPCERKPGSKTAPSNPTETPSETVCRRILASADAAFREIRAKPWVVDKDMMDSHSEAIRSVITKCGSDWKESLIPFEGWNSYRFGADANLDHEKYGVRIVPCSVAFSKQVR